MPLGWSVARFAMTPYDEEAVSDPAREPPDHVLVAGVGDALESMLLSHDLVERIATEGLISRLGRRDEARADRERAASLTKDDRERALLLKRAAATQN